MVGLWLCAQQKGKQEADALYASMQSKAKNLDKSSVPLADDPKTQQFDGIKERSAIDRKEAPSDEASTFLNDPAHKKNFYDIKSDDPLLMQADKVVQNPHGQIAFVESTTKNDSATCHTCTEAVDDVSYVFTRVLNVNVIRHPPITRECFTCTSGQHRDNDQECCARRYYTVTVQNETFEEKEDTWVSDKADSAQKLEDVECAIVESNCIEGPESRVINGKSVHRPCWRERVTMLCQYKDDGLCKKLRLRGCMEQKQECLQYGLQGRCAVYKKTYRCVQNDRARTTISGVDAGLMGPDLSAPYEKDAQFSEVASKLLILDEMGKDLKGAAVSENIQVFGGQCLTCTRNVLGSAMYDCCGNKGLAKAIGLANCTAEEQSLADKRGKKICHYVGSFANKFIINTSHVHSFCCFNSKLILIVQEAARRQLGIGWGTPKSSDCRGLTTEEISRINFDGIDLSEVYEDMQKSFKAKEFDKAGAEARIKKRVSELSGGVRPR